MEDHKTCILHFQVKHEFKTRTNLFKPEALEILEEVGEDSLGMADLDSDCLEDGTEDSFDTNHMEEEHPDTKLDQDGLNLQIENTRF